MRNARARLHGNRHARSSITFRVTAEVRIPLITHIFPLSLALALPSPRSLQIFSPGPRRRGLCSSAAIFYHRSLAPSAPPLPRKITFLPFCSDLSGSFRRRHYRFCAVSPTAFLSGNILCLQGFSQIKKESGDSFSNRHGAVSRGSCKYCSAAFVLCRAPGIQANGITAEVDRRRITQALRKADNITPILLSFIKRDLHLQVPFPLSPYVAVRMRPSNGIL